VIVKLIGGISDGLTLDTDLPPRGWCGEWFTLPVPNVLRVHVARPNRTVYRLASATPDEAIYRIDPAATERARLMSAQEWRDADDDQW
jgi:hypothetical protein